METVVVLLSGGIDSFALAHLLQSGGHHVECLFVDFGQPATEMEQAATKKVSSTLGIKLQTVSVVFPKNFSAGEIVGRNAFLIATALASADKVPNLIAIGVHSGTDYYDCSSHFIARQDQLIAEMTGGRCRLVAPFEAWSKADVLHYARSERLDLALTYSCEAGQPTPCGLCLSCLDREDIQ